LYQTLSDEQCRIVSLIESNEDIKELRDLAGVIPMYKPKGDGMSVSICADDEDDRHIVRMDFKPMMSHIEILGACDELILTLGNSVRRAHSQHDAG
jgi:hypothetical protein